MTATILLIVHDLILGAVTLAFETRGYWWLDQIWPGY